MQGLRQLRTKREIPAPEEARQHPPLGPLPRSRHDDQGRTGQPDPGGAGRRPGGGPGPRRGGAGRRRPARPRPPERVVRPGPDRPAAAAAAGPAGLGADVLAGLSRTHAVLRARAARLSTRTQAPPAPGRTQDRSMLWSDPENKPPKELRDAQDDAAPARACCSRSAMLVAMFVLGVR